MQKKRFHEKFNLLLPNKYIITKKSVLPWTIFAVISLNCWDEDKAQVFKSTTNWRSKPWLCNICFVSFHNWSNSLSVRFLFPLWNSLFLEFLRSATNESYFFGNLLYMIFGYSVRSNSFSSVIPFFGQRTSSWSLNLHIFRFKGSNSLYNYCPPVGRFSFLWRTSWHKHVPP